MESCAGIPFNTALPSQYLCPFITNDFSKGGMALTISAPITDENKTIRFTAQDGVCYEATLLDPQTMNVFHAINIEDDLVTFDESVTPTPTPTPTPTATPTQQPLNFEALTSEYESLPIVDRENLFRFVGTVVKVDLEGGFYGIELPSTSGGIKYLPINLQSELIGKEGTEINVSSVFTKKDFVGFQMWGTYIYVNTFNFIFICIS